MATTATLDDFTDRRAGDDDMSCYVVLSAVPESPGETTRAAVRRDLIEFFSSIGWDDPETDTERVLAKDSPATFPADDVDRQLFCYGTTGSCLDDLERVADAGDVSAVYVTGVGSLGTDHAEIVASLDRIGELLPDGTGVMISGVGWVSVASDDFGALRAAWAASADAAIARQREACKRDIRQWAGVEYEGGRPGLGFEAVDGELVPGPDYTEVCSVLELVLEYEATDGEQGMSKSKAAAHLGTSPRTIRRCIEDRPDRYGL